MLAVQKLTLLIDSPNIALYLTFLPISGKTIDTDISTMCATWTVGFFSKEKRKLEPALLSMPPMFFGVLCKR